MSANPDRIHLIYILECIVNVEELTASGRAAFEAAKHDRAAALYLLFADDGRKHAAAL